MSVVFLCNTKSKQHSKGFILIEEDEEVKGYYEESKLKEDVKRKEIKEERDKGSSELGKYRKFSSFSKNPAAHDSNKEERSNLY